jgi:predicted nucleic acid-binding Zn ribbon protein
MISDNDADIAPGDGQTGRLGDELNRLLRRLGSEPASSLSSVFDDWGSIVGEQVAAHVSPVRLQDGRLLVEVDDPTWATQMRFLESHIISSISARTSVAITAIEVRVKRNPHNA